MTRTASITVPVLPPGLAKLQVATVVKDWDRCLDGPEPSDRDRRGVNHLHVRRGATATVESIHGGDTLRVCDTRAA